ncbi:hypothetical protein [Celerinatantimonas yamalensis]|uniref:Uncharacterized protein n=1 Tax=Celerinatantimonas yamalensis TaxID=559956 RepID=A0ABW9GAR5_9GAMM
MDSIGVAMGYRFEKKSQQYSLEYRYSISSAELDLSRFAGAVRGHWGIEYLDKVLAAGLKVVAEE